MRHARLALLLPLLTLASCGRAPAEPTPLAAPVAAKPAEEVVLPDALSPFLAKYGDPDHINTNEPLGKWSHDTYKVLVYARENIAVRFVPASETSVAPPFARWKLSRFEEAGTKRPLDAVAAAERLAKRLTRTAADDWHDAGLTATFGAVTVRVTDARVELVPLVQKGRETTSKKPQLVVGIEITNSDAAKPRMYHGWAMREIAVETKPRATLADERGNRYRSLAFGSAKVIGQQPAGGTLQPGVALTDRLVFEPPAREAQYLHLELPATSLGERDSLRLRIPTTMIVR